MDMELLTKDARIGCADASFKQGTRNPDPPSLSPRTDSVSFFAHLKARGFQTHLLQVDLPKPNGAWGTEETP